MKKLILILFIVGCYFHSDAQYVIKKMSEYPAKIGTPPAIDYALFNDSGVTKRVTITQICAVCGSGSVSYNDTLTVIATRHDVDSLYANTAKVPISFSAVTGQQTYQGNTAGANFVATLSGLTAGAVIDQITDCSSILSPVSDFITQGDKTITFIAPTLITGNQIVIFWHIP